MVNNFRAMSTHEDVLFESINNKGVITLNRPKALNALNLSMLKKLLLKFKEWEKKKEFVLIKGAGDKAFCAGGDIKAIAEAGLKNDKYGHHLVRNLYTLIGILGTYGVPYIALIDGIIIGGGVGLSIHGRYRIATERTMLALPETEIGVFPDAGASYYLPRLGGKLGTYLGLTGHRLKGVDVLKAGIATHYVESHKLKDLENALLDSTSEQNIKEILKKFCTKGQMEFSLSPYLSKINKCFRAASVENIFQELEKDGSEWAQNTLKTLKKRSPTSLKVSLKAINVGSKLSLQECLHMDYTLVVNFLAKKDFYEG